MVPGQRRSRGKAGLDRIYTLVYFEMVQTGQSRLRGRGKALRAAAAVPVLEKLSSTPNDNLREVVARALKQIRGNEVSEQ